MDLYTFGIIPLLACLIFACIVGISILRGPDRFWLPPIIIWVGLLMTLFLLNDFNDNSVLQKENSHAEQVKKGAEEEAWLAMRKARQTRDSVYNRSGHLLGGFSFIALFCMMFGYKKTQLLYYRKAAVTFFVACVVYLLWCLFW